MNNGLRQLSWHSPAEEAVRGPRFWVSGGPIAWLIVASLALGAGGPVRGESPFDGQDTASWRARPLAANRGPVVDDVALRPDGTLLGRAVLVGQDRSRRGLAGAGIVLRSRSRTVAQTASDADGRFAVPHLSGGVYELVLRTPQGLRSYYCRLWSASAAPPNALGEIELVDNGWGGQVVRGQSPFPAATIGRVAAVAGIAAGAIAVPVIYNTKKTEWIPASP